MKQVLSGVLYCHTKNIVHRDLKPQNILFESQEKNSKLKIIDFGTSQIFDPSKKMKLKIGTPYYVAPEVLRHSYDNKCDIWSCGVILYVLLCGYPPFDGKNEPEVLAAIKKGSYTMKGKEWDCVSDSAKELVKNMLIFRPDDRYSAKQALEHKWIQQFADKEIDKEATKSLLQQMKHFTAQHKLQQAALTYIVTQLTTKSEKAQLESVFLSLDKTGEGKLSTVELINGFKLVNGEGYPAEEEVMKIMEHVDMDNNGFIDYSEFVIATIDKSKLLSKERLIAAFKMFDTVLKICLKM